MRTRLAITVVAAAVLLTGCGQARQQAATQVQPAGWKLCEATEGAVSIATGNIGGVYNLVGGGLAELISSNTRLKARAAETGASVQNIEQLARGDFDIAFALADIAAEAVQGKGSFKQPQRVQALSRIYSNYTQVVVRADSGIDSVAELRGKRVATGTPKSGTDVIATRLLRSAGLDPDTDVKPQRQPLRQAVDAMRTGHVDALIFSGGLPTPELSDLVTAMPGKVRFLDLAPLMGAMQQVNPVYDRGVIPASTYRLGADVHTIVVPNLLLVRDNFDSENACAITKLIFERKAELERVHPAVHEIDRALAVRTGPVPLHPGVQLALG